MSYDPVRDVVVLYGGGAFNGQWANLQDTWEYDGQDWTQIATTSAPTGSFGVSLVYDLRRQRHVLFGGSRRTGPNTWQANDETWEYDGQDWTQVATSTAPSPRTGSSLAYDARRGVTVLFGGDSLSPYSVMHNDTWEYNGSTWTRILTPFAPSPRAGPGFANNAARGRVMLCGGYTNTFGSSWIALSDTWEYDGAAWRQLLSAGGPAFPSGAGMVYDLAANRCTLERISKDGTTTPVTEIPIAFTNNLLELQLPILPEWAGKPLRRSTME